MVAVGGWTRTKPSDLARGARIGVVEGTAINLPGVGVFTSLGEYLVFIYPSIQPMLPCFSSGTTTSKRCFPPHAGRRMPTLVPEGSIFRLPSLFPSENPFYFPLSSAPPPNLSLPPASLPVLVLSSLMQVGEESGTSRQRSRRLYTGARYPLLYWRMGRHKKKEWGKKGEGRMEGVHTTKNNQVLNFPFCIYKSDYSQYIDI